MWSLPSCCVETGLGGLGTGTRLVGGKPGPRLKSCGALAHQPQLESRETLVAASAGAATEAIRPTDMAVAPTITATLRIKFFMFSPPLSSGAHGWPCM